MTYGYNGIYIYTRVGVLHTASAAFSQTLHGLQFKARNTERLRTGCFDTGLDT